MYVPRGEIYVHHKTYVSHARDIEDIFSPVCKLPQKRRKLEKLEAEKSRTCKKNSLILSIRSVWMDYQKKLKRIRGSCVHSVQPTFGRNRESRPTRVRSRIAVLCRRSAFFSASNSLPTPESIDSSRSD